MTLKRITGSKLANLWPKFWARRLLSHSSLYQYNALLRDASLHSFFVVATTSIFLSVNEMIMKSLAEYFTHCIFSNWVFMWWFASLNTWTQQILEQKHFTRQCSEALKVWREFYSYRFTANLSPSQQSKNFENRLRFDKVIDIRSLPRFWWITI